MLWFLCRFLCMLRMQGTERLYDTNNGEIQTDDDANGKSDDRAIE